jgi:hypothetical protein
MRPYKLTYYIYSTAHALGTCTEHVTSSEDTRDVTRSRQEVSADYEMTSTRTIKGLNI